MTNKRKVRRAKNLNSKRKELLKKRRIIATIRPIPAMFWDPIYGGILVSNFWTVTESKRASSLVRMHGAYVRQLVNFKKRIVDIFNSAEN